MSASSLKIFWDTNLWVYLFDSDSPDKQEASRQLLAQDHDRIITSTQVLQEFYVTVTRKLANPLDTGDAAQVLRSVAEFCAVNLDVQMICSAADLSREHSLSFWDALIIEAAIAGGATTLLSEDFQSGRTFRSVTILNPFEQNAGS